jgi:hypothetical protein
MAQTQLHGLTVQEKLNAMNMDVITVAPTLSLSAYQDEDSLFGLTKIPNAVAVEGGACLLQSVMMLDFGELSDQWTMDLYFFSNNKDSDWPNGNTAMTAGVDSKSKAQNLFYQPNMFLGKLGFSQEFYDFPEASDHKVRFKQALNTGIVLKAASGSTDVYMAGHLKSSTPDYAAQGDLVFQIGVIKD